MTKEIKKYTKIDKDALRSLRVDMAEALQILGDSLGLKLSLGNAHFDRGGVNGDFKLHLEVLETANGKSPAQVNFEAYAVSVGMKPEDFGREFTLSNTRLKLVGINPTASVKCLLAKGVDNGSSYTLPVQLYYEAIHLAEARAQKAAANASGSNP